MPKTCKTDKVVYDKKGAITLVNLTMELHHIKMRAYNCPDCGWWHLSSVGKHKPFRHSAKKF